MLLKNKQLSFLKTFIRYLRPHIGGELLLLLLMITTSTGSLATPYILKIIIDDIFPKGSYTQLVWILLVLVVIYVVRIFCSICTDIVYTRISQRMITAIRADVVRNVFARPIHFFREISAGDVLFAVMNDVQNIQSAVSVLVLSFATDVLTVIGIVIMLAIINFKLTLISLLVLPFILFSIRKFTPHLQSNFRNSQKLQEALNNFVLEKIRNIRVLKSYNTTAHELESLHKLQAQEIRVNTRNTLLSSLNSNITVFLVAIGPVIVLMYGGKAVFEKLLTIGSLIAFIQYLNRLYAPTMSIMNSFNNFTKALVSMERVHKYLIYDESQSVGVIQIPRFQRIIFDNVSLKLNDKLLLHDVSLEFERGKIYGIIGPSGSGKSTISNLLCDFMRPTKGCILLDGLTSVSDLSDWQNSIGLIEKENQLFTQSISENIRYGSFCATESEITKAAMEASLLDVLENLPQGMNTEINEAGSTLSDGQKQRISIARALLKKADILILDEATAALDQQLEHQIISNLKQYQRNAIIIIITHRLHSLRSVDYVYSVNKGTIVKEGTPEHFIHNGVSNHYKIGTT